MAQPLSDEPVEPAVTPKEVARKSFEVTRRGFDTAEVRRYLDDVSAALKDAQEREAEIRSRLGKAVRRAEEAEKRAETAETAAVSPANLDADVLTEHLGAEVAKVLNTAREVATKNVADAEAEAERIVEGGEISAAEFRQKAEAVLAEAQAEAERIRIAAASEADTTRKEAEKVHVEAQKAREALIDAAEIEAEGIRGEAEGVLEARMAEADVAVAEVMRQAEAKAAGLRREAEGELKDAKERAAQEIATARGEGDVLVKEAEQARAQILTDMDRRRQQVRSQVERLRAGRDRLMRSHDVVRRSLDEVTNELKFSLTEAKLKGDAAARRVQAEAPATVDQLEAEVSDAALVGLIKLDERPKSRRDFGGRVVLPGGSPKPSAAPAKPPAAPEPVAEVAPAPEPEPVAEVAPVPKPEPEPVAEVAPAAPEPEPEPVAEAVPAAPEPVAPDPEPEPVAEAAPAAPEPEPEPVAEAAIKPERSGGVSALFAAMRSEAGESESEAPGESESEATLESDPEAPGVPESEAAVESDPEAPGEAESEAPGEPESGPAPEAEAAEGPDVSDDAGVVAERDQQISEIEIAVARRLKRVLSDEQNILLEASQNATDSAPELEDLLGDVAAHIRSYSAAIDGDLDAARIAGGTFVGAAAKGKRPDLDHIIASELVDVLRKRLTKLLAGDLDELNRGLRSLYREIKTKRISALATHLSVTAFSQGSADALEPGSSVRWVFCDVEAGCPDGHDNSLAGIAAVGDAFPSGHAHPPVSQHCRCVLVAADG